MNTIRNQENSQTTSQTLINLQIESINVALSKPNSVTRAVNYIACQCLYYKNNFYESAATIANRLGVSERTVSKAIKLARSLGIIHRRRRFNNSNTYKLNSQLHKPEIITMLAAVLPAIRGILCLSILIPIATLCKPYPIRDLQEKCRLYYKNEILINSSSYSSSRDIVRRGEIKTGATSLGQVLGSLLGTKPRKMQMSEYEENQNLKREDHKPENKAATYGGTGLYDRKTSQKEVDLLARVRERQRKINAEYVEKKAMLSADKESQPRFDEPKPRPAIQVSREATEDPIEVSRKFSEWMASEDYKRKVALFGEEVMFKMCGKVVHNLLEGDF